MDNKLKNVNINVSLRSLLEHDPTLDLCWIFCGKLSIFPYGGVPSSEWMPYYKAFFSWLKNPPEEETGEIEINPDELEKCVEVLKSLLDIDF